MADRKISALPGASTLSETDVLPLVQDGDTVRASLQDVSAFIAGQSETITTPADLPNLLAWYDASDSNHVYSDLGLTPITNGGSVKQWDDISGNGLHLYETSTATPVWNNNTLNSLPAVHFISDWPPGTKLTTAINAVPMGTETVSVFAVAQRSTVFGWQILARLIGFRAQGSLTSATTGANLDQETDANTEGGVAFLLHSLTDNKIASYRNAVELATSPVTMTANVGHRLGVVYDGLHCTTYFDLTSTAQSTSGGPLAAFGTFRVGAGWITFPCPGQCGLWDGHIGEIVVCRAALTAAQITQLDEYFTTKWGL